MKVDKYDRQIRLWGVQGQRRLGEAKVALLGSSGAGIQTLKNLVLPGVGEIDIWDDRNVALSDLSSSFFYAPEDIGKPRAEAVSANLLQMNPDVKGVAIVAKPSSILEQRQKLRSYSLIIVGDLPLNEQAQISRSCWEEDVPAIFITVIGFYIYVRNQKKVHVIQFERTASKKYYLRLDHPFPALRQHSKKWNIPELMGRLAKASDQKERKEYIHELEHIPYPTILIQLYEMWPEKERTKEKIINQIKEWSILLGEGYRENFSQAASRYFDLMQTPDNFLRGLDRFESDFVKNAKVDSQPGLIFLRICGEILKRKGHLPQPTDLPDMQTSTNLYIELKEVYKTQHEEDIKTLEQIMKEIYGEIPLSRNKLSELINNLEAIQIMEIDPYYKELQKIENPMLEWLEPEWRHILLAIRSWQLFGEKEGRVPTLKDFEVVFGEAQKLCSQFGFQKLQEERYVRQVCRVEGQSLGNIYSIAGAVGGQEGIKLIAQCFTPVKNGFVFSGVHGRGFPVSL